ncbi:MAG: hypothetical protein IT178_16820 [Acidobacteria bacterium]|nr:hypothetical protein [Acidobacteriota bacterium]
MKRPLASDTDPEIEARQIDAWRRMTPEEKWHIVEAMNQTVRELALAGIRDRFPNASPREQFLRLAQLRLGDDLAREVYPELDEIDPR